MNLENDLPKWCHTTPADGVPITDSYRSSRIEGHSGIFQIITTPYYCAKRHSAPPNVFLSGIPRIPRQPTGLCVPCWKAWESRTTFSLSNQIILSDQGPALAVLGGRARAKRGRCQHPVPGLVVYYWRRKREACQENGSDTGPPHIWEPGVWQKLPT